MHDIRTVRTDPAAFDAAMARRGLPPVSERILELDRQVRAATTTAQARQADRNARSKRIGELMRSGRTEEAAALRADIEQAVDDVDARDGTRELENEIRGILEALPNILDPDVPD